MATVVWYSNPTSGNAMDWTDSNQWNTATDGSGTAGNPDSTDDKAIIQSGDTVTLDTNVTTGQCSVLGTLTGNASYSLTLAGSDEDNNFSNSGTLTNLNIIMTGLRASGDRSIIDSGSGIRDLTINDTTNSGNNVHKLGNNLSISGDLTITSGTLSTVTPAGGSVGLTVTGDVSVTGTLTGNASAISMGSLTVNGIYNATSGTTIITSERSNGRAIDIVGTFNDNGGILEIKTPADTLLRWPSSSDVNHLKINHASCIARPTGDNKPVIAGNLLVTAGEFNTLEGGQNHALTVTGSTSGAGTLTLNNSTYTGGGSGSNLAMLGTVTIGTSGVITNVDQLGENGSGGGTITVTGSPTLGHRRLRQLQSKWTAGTSTLKIENGTHAIFGNDNTYAIPHHFELDNSGNTVELEGNFTVTGDMTITAGTLDTSSSNNRSLTVTGDASITGTLTGNASAITIGKMLEIKNTGIYNETSGTTLISGQPDGDYVLRNHDGGTYTKHATGILKIARTSASGTKYAKFGEDVYNDVKLENTSSGSVVAIVGVMNLAGDLTVVEGELRSYGGTGAIDVDGDVSIEDGGKFSTETSQLTAGGVNADFGSLTIASGGTYDATPLTTTITAKDTGGSGYAWNNSGTFTHNNGKVKFTDDDHIYLKESLFYDLECALSNTSKEFRWDDKASNLGTVLGDFTITSGRFKFNTAGDTWTVHGLTKLESDGQFGLNSPSGTHTFNGLVTVNGGTWNLSSGTNNMAGIRNVGGTIS